MSSNWYWFLIGTVGSWAWGYSFPTSPSKTLYRSWDLGIEHRAARSFRHCGRPKEAQRARRYCGRARTRAYARSSAAVSTLGGCESRRGRWGSRLNGPCRITPRVRGRCDGLHAQQAKRWAASNQRAIFTGKKTINLSNRGHFLKNECNTAGAVRLKSNQGRLLKFKKKNDLVVKKT